MARKIIWTNVAWDDLEQAANFIAKDSVYYAATFVLEIKEAAQSLRIMAERGRVVPEFNNLSIRELLVENYRLIYKITKQAVYIIGFIHGARDLWLLWKHQGH